MSITLFDIFYQHKEWWNDPSLGHDTQGKYGKVLAEMECCALEYAKDIKEIGDNWKRVIEKETRELCRPNHYSFFLTGEKKEWHDSVVEDFLLYIRKALEHYGYNFKELPEIIQKQYGIEYLRKAPKPQPETPQQANNGSDVEKAGRKKKEQPEAKKPKTFRDRVTGGNETLPQILHKLMDGKSGKDALIYLAVSIKNGKCQKPTYEQAKEEFGDFTGRANYYRYLDINLYTKDEIEAANKAIKEAADTLTK